MKYQMRFPEKEILDEDIRFFIDVIKTRSDYDFTNYSLKSLKRRLNKVLSDNNLSMDGLIGAIGNDRIFMETVVKSITVSTTDLFRDPDVWLMIMHDILPLYINKDIIRIWHPGCSTGQEVYSMMIILSELGVFNKSEIYASDINVDVLERAKEGKYKYVFNHLYLENFDTVFNTKSVPPDGKKVLYEKYFTVDKPNDIIQMKPFLREKPNYKKIDLVRDENLFNLKFDLIICRNVIIYFNLELQNKVFNLFYNNLYNNGCLVLGLHESIPGQYTSLFNKKETAYFKRSV